jgi:hypothetical protein
MREYQYEVWAGWRFTRTFPEDMLRYDQARIIDQYDREPSEFDGKPLKVYVIQGKREPTVGRWKSFMWEVGPVSRIRT